MSGKNFQILLNRRIWVHVKIEHISRYIDVPKDIEIQVLRLLIAEKFNIEPERLRISYEGKSLKDTDTFEDLGINEFHTIQVNVKAPKSCAATVSRLNGKGFGLSVSGNEETFEEDLTEQLLNLPELIKKTERLKAFVNQPNFQYVLNYSSVFYEWLLSNSRLHMILQCDSHNTNLMKDSKALKKLVDSACCSGILEQMRNNIDGFTYKDGAGDSVTTYDNEIALIKDLRELFINDSKPHSEEGTCNYISKTETEMDEVSFAGATEEVCEHEEKTNFLNQKQIFQNISENHDNLVSFIHSKPVRFFMDNLAKNSDFIDLILSYNENDMLQQEPLWIESLASSFNDLEYVN